MSLPVVGQTVQIQKQVDGIQGHARVLDLKSEGIYIDVPLTVGKGSWMDFSNSEIIHISYTLADGAVYHFKSTMLMRTKVDQLPAMLLRLPEPSQITRLQRRSFVRVEVALQLSILRIRPNDASPLSTGNGMTYDLSGGGLSFRPLDAMEIAHGDQITVKFGLPNDQEKVLPISAKGHVVRLAHDEYNRLLYCINFEQLSPSGQQRIIQYVFRRQIELRSKGLF